MNSVICPRLSEMGHFRSVQFSSGGGETFSQSAKAKFNVITYQTTVYPKIVDIKTRIKSIKC